MEKQEIPTIEETHEQLPGEVVLRFRKSKDNSSWGMNFTVRKRTEENCAYPYEAAIPYRSCVYSGRTLEESIANLLLGISILGRDGAFDPNDPEKSGSPPVQHAIHVLTQHLLRQVEARRDHLGDAHWVPGGHVTYTDLSMMPGYLKKVDRDNEVIAALSTAIAALARVKDL